MIHKRFDAVPEKHGTWRVRDLRTGQSAHHLNHLMVRMGQDEADAAADLLNRMTGRDIPPLRGD